MSTSVQVQDNRKFGFLHKAPIGHYRVMEGDLKIGDHEELFLAMIEAKNYSTTETTGPVVVYDEDGLILTTYHSPVYPDGIR